MQNAGEDYQRKPLWKDCFQGGQVAENCESNCSISCQNSGNYYATSEITHNAGYEIYDYRRIPLWKDVKFEDWTDWKWQVRNRITTVKTLSQVVNLSPKEQREIKQVLNVFRMAITPYYANLFSQDDPNCPIRKQAIPSKYELLTNGEDLSDPLSESEDSPVEGLTHRYPDRVLCLSTDCCAMYCRHCTRRRLVGITETHVSQNQFDLYIEYIRNHPEVRDVILSGGDVLMLSDSQIEYRLRRLREIPHVEIIRLGTRMPVTLPFRITDELVQMIKKYHPVWLNTHFNHPKEITKESAKAIDTILSAGIPVNNQSVLLKGINDCPHIMKKLVQGLLKIRVRPYYLFQCDLAQGIGHFRTSVSKGIQIMEMLRGHTSGLGIPTFVIDAPNGGGKIPILPNYLISQSDKEVIIRNYEGFITSYTEPEDKTSKCPPNCTICNNVNKSNEGIAKLFNKETRVIIPKDTLREKRRQIIKKQKAISLSAIEPSISLNE